MSSSKISDVRARRVWDSRGRPTVAVASREFAALASQMARELRFPDARVAVVPHPIGGTDSDTLDDWARAALDDLERLLR